jgi:Helicase associated domain
MERLTGIGFRFGPTQVDFETRFLQLAEYKAVHSHTRVPISYTAHDNLGRYVKKTKEQYHAGKLAPARIDRLQTIGFDFSRRGEGTSAAAAAPKKTTRVDFETRFLQLAEYKAIHSHTRVPISYTAHDNLGRFVKTTREQYHAGKLAPARIVKLETIGFDFSRRGEKKSDSTSDAAAAAAPTKAKKRGANNNDSTSAAAATAPKMKKKPAKSRGKKNQKTAPPPPATLPQLVAAAAAAAAADGVPVPTIARATAEGTPAQETVAAAAEGPTVPTPAPQNEADLPLETCETSQLTPADYVEV